MIITVEDGSWDADLGTVTSPLSLRDEPEVPIMESGGSSGELTRQDETLLSSVMGYG